MNKLLNKPQPLHPTPYHDESLSGYLLRFSYVNGIPARFLYGKLDLFNEKRTIKSYFIDLDFLNKIDLEVLKNITNNRTADILNMTIAKHTSPDIVFCGNRICRDDIEIVRVKICPFCLLEREYFRKIWLLGNVTACPQHKVVLIDSCSICSEQISWRKGNIFLCRCGHQHKKSQVVLAATETVNFSEYIYSMCDLYKGKLTFRNKSEFIDCDLLTLNRMHRFLGREITTGLSIENKYRRGDISLLEYVQVQLNVIRILKSWPDGYRKFLNSLNLTTYSNLYYLERSLMKTQRVNGYLKPLIEEYLLYVQPIKEKIAQEEEEKQKSEIKEFEMMVEKFIIYEKELSLKRKTQGLLNINEVGKILKCQEWHIKFWMMKGLFNNIEDGLGNLIPLVSLKKFKRTYITLKEIQKKLNTSYSQLSRKGIEPVSGLKIDGGRMYLYQKKI